MQLRTKKIIAREGLIFVGTFASWFVSWIFVGHIFNIVPNGIGDLFLSVLYYTIPTYPVVSFVVWAIRTLRKK